MFKVLFCGHMMRNGFRFTKEVAARGGAASLLNIVECASEEVLGAIEDAHVVVPLMSKIDARLLESAQQLRMILQFGVGLESVDVGAATTRGVMVSNIPSNDTGNARSCAEHAIFLTLALLRQLSSCQKAVQERRLGEPCGETLFGKRVLVLGCGNIARNLMPLLHAFGAEVTCVRRSAWQDEGREDQLTWPPQAVRRVLHSDLPGLLPESDVIIVTMSQNASNIGMIGKEFLSQCKRGVCIVNVARGGIIDRGAALEAVTRGHVAGLGLDVQWTEPVPPDDELIRHPCVITTPHIAGVTQLSYRNMAKVVVRESLRVQQGLEPTVWVNKQAMHAGAAVL